MIDKTDPTNRDTVPAMLTPGEFVLNKEASTMFAPVIEQMNAAGLQHRAMKNMGGGIQNYNDGGYSFMKPTSKFRGALKDLEADSYSTLFANSEKKETPWKGVDITGMSMAEVLALVKPNGAFHKYNKDNFDKNTTAVGKYQFVGSTLRDLKKRGVFEKLGIDDDTPFNESTQDALAAYLAVHRVKDRTKGTMSSAREELRNEWEGFKKLDDNQLDDIINEISGEVGVTLVGTTPQVPTQAVSVAPITSIPPQMRPKDLAPQMTTGTIDTMASSRPQMRPNTQADPISIEQAIMQASVPQVQAAPPAPTDFGEAFKDARADMGAGGIFTFRGRDYTTNYAEEEDKTMTANMGGSVYLNMGGYPQEYLDNYRKAIMANMGPEYLARIERIVSKDAARELQAQVRPDYTPGNIEEDSASSEPMAYNDPALKARSDGEIDLRWSDRMLDKNLYLSQPGTGMTTEESIAKRKNLASNSYVPMPEVNSDESLLQGSSGSVASAARSFPSDYPINMDVPKVEGYNIPAPIPAPRPTMIGGQLYYLNGDGLVTDSNGNPVQDPEIGAAVQDKLNYSPEESAANAQAYNESMAEQAVFNGVAPQSVNPSYDSMRQQQESNAAEAERIRAEIAQIDMERQALNDEFNNREPVVVPPLERGPPLFVEGFVPDVPAYEGELGGLMPPYEGELGGGNIPNLNPAANLDVGHPDRVAAIEAGTLEPTDADFDWEENQMRLTSDLQRNRLMQSVADEYGKTVGGDGSLKSEEQRLAAQLSGVPFIDYPPIESADIASSLPPELTEDAVIASGLPQAKTNPTVILQAANEIQTAEDAIEKAKRDLATAETGIRNAATAEQVAKYEEMGRQAKTDLTTSSADLAKAQETQSKIDEVDAAAEADKATLIKTTKAQADAAREAALSSLGFSTGPKKKGPGSTKGPMIKTGPNGTILDANGKPIVNLTPQQAITSDAAAIAKAEADRIAAAGGGKNTPEVSGAMSMLKGVFGDLFDSKELIRAAIMYLGGRATGMDGQQALAFAGKNYIARTDAKTSFYNEQATSGKWTNGSLAKFKKTRDPAHLIPIGAVYKATGVAPQAYYDKATGNMVMFEQHQIGKDGSKIWVQAGKDPRDSKYRLDHSRMTQDTFNVKSTDAYITRWDKAENDFADIITAELLQYEIPADGDRAKSNSLRKINATTDAKAVSAFAQKYDITPDAMALVIRNAMRKAGDDVKFSRIDEVNDLTPYLKESYITTHTGDKSNFMIGNGKKGKAYSEKLVSSEEFSSWLGQTQRTMIDLLPDANLDQYNPVQFSQKLMQLPIYKEWMGEDEEVRSDFATQGRPNRSGFMEYISKNLAKGVVNS